MRMRTRFGILAAVFVAATTTRVFAQPAPSPLLDELQLRQLATHAQPADHARLAAHFTALADEYGADAKRHEAMAAAETSGRNAGPGVHCRQLAALDAALAATSKELAAFHSKEAVGLPAVPPADPAGLAAGKGARRPTAAELAAAGERAAKANDHRGLADYFTALAKRYAGEASTHAGMSAAYHRGRMPGMSTHCDRLVRDARAAAKEARLAASMHRTLATAKK